MKVCCRAVDDEEGECVKETSSYNNKAILVLFPLVFFSTAAGIVFLCWPGEGLDSLSDGPKCNKDCEGLRPGLLLILGSLLTGIAGISAILIIILVCRLHIKGFDRRSLPQYALEFNRSSNRRHHGARSNSRVLPQIYVKQSLQPTIEFPHVNQGSPGVNSQEQETEHLSNTTTIEHEANGGKQTIQPPRPKSLRLKEEDRQNHNGDDNHDSFRAEDETTHERRSLPVGRLPPINEKTPHGAQHGAQQLESNTTHL